MPKRIAIIGAGISGLATAYFLKQKIGSQAEIYLFEKSNRPGGWLQTIQKEEFRFECGPHSFRATGNGQLTLNVLESLGLQEQVVIPSANAFHRYIYDGKALQKMPLNMWQIPFNRLSRGWLSTIWKDLCGAKRVCEDESIHAFFTRRLGQYWTENLIDPFVSGIYAGDIHSLSLKSCFPLLDQWEQKHGSLFIGAWKHRSPDSSCSSFVKNMQSYPLYTLRNGMESFSIGLAKQLKECLHFQEEVTELSFSPDCATIQLQGGKRLTVDTVISTIPMFALSQLVSNIPDLSQQLQKLHYASVVVIHVGFKTPVLPQQGFGYLIPSSVQTPLLGCIWDSSIFPEQNHEINHTRLTFMIGGARHPEVQHRKDEEVRQLVLQSLRQQMGIQVVPDVMHVMRAKRAIPQYHVGYSDWKQEMLRLLHQTTFQRLYLTGSGWSGVSINDCISDAQHISQQMF